MSNDRHEASKAASKKSSKANDFVRQGLQEELTKELNKALNRELHSSYLHLAIMAYFQRVTVSLPGFVKYFAWQSRRTLVHAKKLMDYIVSRGGMPNYHDVSEPPHTEFDPAVSAFQEALRIEKWVNKHTLELHKLAVSLHDASCAEFVEREFLRDQMTEIKNIGDTISRLHRAGKTVGVHIVDRQLARMTFNE